MSEIVSELTASYDKVKEWPENSETGFMDLIALRNLVPKAIQELNRLREENERLRKIGNAAYRLAYVVRKSVNAGPVSNDPTAEGQAWRSLRLALGENYDEKGELLA